MNSHFANFQQFGCIIGVNIREDRLTGKPKGFAFVTYDDDESASRAIAGMHNYSYGGRTLTVNQASVRGSDAKNDEPDVDNSWKTVPILAPSARGKKTGQDGKKSTGSAKAGEKPQATWDHWAGPVAKAPSAKTVPAKAAAVTASVAEP